MAVLPSTRSLGTRVSTRQPLLYAALAFAAGVVGGEYAWRPPLWVLTAILVFCLATAWCAFRRRAVARTLGFSTLFWLGMFAVQVTPLPALPDIARFTDGNRVLVTGYVIKEGYLRNDGFGTRWQSFDLKTEQIEGAQGRSSDQVRLRVSLYSPAKTRVGENAPVEMPTVVCRYGQRIRAELKLHSPRNYRNPGAFDAVAYLRQQGIAALGTGKMQDVTVVSGFKGTSLESWRTRVHHSIIEMIHDLWPPQQAALLDAMMIGEDAFLTPDSRTDFQRSGTYHILVVSGLNVSILAFVVFWIFRRLRASQVVAGGITVVLAVIYAFLTDVGAPVWRAVLMLTMFLAVRLLYRDRSILNAIGGAALGLMIIDPRAVLGASFQLTCLSVLIIAGIGVPVLQRTSEPYKRGLQHLDSIDYDVSLPPRVAQFRLDLRFIAARLTRLLGRWLPLRMLRFISRGVFSAFEVLTISALMQIGLALPMAWYFHRATVMGLPANILAVPLAEILMPSAVIAVGVGYISMGVAKFPAFLTALALHGITGTMHWLGSLRVADWRVPTPDPGVITFALLSLVLALILAPRRAILMWAGLAGLTAASLVLAIRTATPRLQPQVLEFTAIDVGQADSSLVVSPQGRTVLVDAGGHLGFIHSEFDIGEQVVSPYLWWRGISRLDAVVLTHAHSDHLGGMRTVLANFKPAELWLGIMPQTEAVAALLRQAEAQKIHVRRPREGDEYEFGGVTVRTLSPPPVATPARVAHNDDSLVLQFVYRNSALLMEGDAEKTSEWRMLSFRPRSDLWKIAHNGSRTSTLPELVSAVKPRIAVISVGARNMFGHPRPEILRRLHEAGASVYRTDLDGAVTFYLDGNEISLPMAALR